MYLYPGYIDIYSSDISLSISANGPKVQSGLVRKVQEPVCVIYLKRWSIVRWLSNGRTERS